MLRSAHLLLLTLFLCSAITAYCQSEVNNLVHAPNYVTGKWGELGEVKKFGSGHLKVILLPGWGFDWRIFKNFIGAHEKDFTIYAVTFPGFGNTAAPPMPSQPENFRDLYWTKGILKGIIDLIDTESMNHPDIITCFTYSEMIAFRLALDHPEKIGRIIITSGMAKYTANYPSFEPRSLGQRTNYIENVLAKKWFKTVTKETWDKGNFAPVTFSKDSVKMREYWNVMAAVPIPVMVRYLCESYCADISLEYMNLTVPILVVLPSFDNKALSDNGYLAPFFHYSWTGAMPSSTMITVVTLTDTHAFIMEDQPAKLEALIVEFLIEKRNQFPPLR